MTEPAPPEAFLHQYISAALGDGPPIEGTTALDGQRIHFLGDPEATGEVLGGSRVEGFAWVRWDAGGTGMHRIRELVRLD